MMLQLFIFIPEKYRKLILSCLVDLVIKSGFLVIIGLRNFFYFQE